MSPIESIARVVEVLSSPGHFRRVKFADRAGVVDRSVRKSELVSHEGNQIRARNNAALGFARKRDDTRVALAVECNDRGGIRGHCRGYRRRSIGRTATDEQEGGENCEDASHGQIIAPKPGHRAYRLTGVVGGVCAFSEPRTCATSAAVTLEA